MKHLLTLPVLLACTAALAAPTLTANPYPPEAIQPAAVSFTVNGGAPKVCTLVPVAGGLQPTCDLASITAPGTYTLVMTATSNAGCVSAPSAATCNGAGSASSAPFAYTWLGNAIAPPVISRAMFGAEPQVAKP